MTTLDALSGDARERLEADLTRKRLVELELDPVRGSFDADHLREVHRRVFQDLPSHGLDHVQPGVFREPVEAGRDWVKNRGLSTVPGSFFVAYSSMDDAAKDRLERVLQASPPRLLASLKTAEFTASFGALYAELDYLHPFAEGNSRALRVFTRQLSRAAGYDVDWARFARSEAGRDLLYIARDRSVNALALPHVAHENTARRVIGSADRLSGNRDLPDLLRDAVRPMRAIAFERSGEADALASHPELASAYNLLHAVRQRLAIDGVSAEQQDVVVTRIRAELASRLERGDLPQTGNRAVARGLGGNDPDRMR